MKIKSNNRHFEIGSSHEDCQDFALTGMINPNIAFAVLSDGCSSSHDLFREVDFGARILGYSSVKVLKEMFADLSEIPSAMSQEVVADLGVKSLKFANEIGKQCGLHDNATDATLLICLSDGKKHNVVLYGDGGFVYKKHGDKNLFYTNIEFSLGAPFYLSYQLSEQRERMYVAQYGMQAAKMDNLSIGEGALSKQDFYLRNEYEMSFYHQTSFHIEADLDFIALTSDGVKSFQKPHPDYPEIIQNQEPEKIIPEMFGFKNFQGQFVERRMKRFKEYCKENNLTHYDDISVSAISFSP